MEDLHLGIYLIKYMKNLYTDKLLLNYFVQSSKLILKFIQPFKMLEYQKQLWKVRVNLEYLYSMTSRLIINLF